MSSIQLRCIKAGFDWRSGGVYVRVELKGQEEKALTTLGLQTLVLGALSCRAVTSPPEEPPDNIRGQGQSQGQWIKMKVREGQEQPRHPTAAVQL